MKIKKNKGKRFYFYMRKIEINNLEITSICNYKCPICVTRSRGSHMQMDEFYKIVDNNYQLFNKNGVWLHFYGEPLANPNFVECVQYIKSKGAKTRISTNGSLLDDRRREAIAESGLEYVVVSISTLDRDTYKRTRGCDKLPQVLDNLFKFKKYIDDHNISTQVQAVMIDTDSGKGKEEFIKFFHDHGINAAFHNFTNRSNSVSLDLFSEQNHDYSVKRGLCVNLDKRIGILSDCRVVTCFCDFEAKNSLGNLREYDYSIEKLMENGRLEKIEENLTKGIYAGACSECSDWIYYQKDSKEKYVTVYPVDK